MLAYHQNVKVCIAAETLVVLSDYEKKKPPSLNTEAILSGM